jgi:hypothetical protein
MNSAAFIKNRRVSPSVAIANDFKTRVLGDNGIYEGDQHLVSLIRMMRHKDLYDRASLILTPNGYKSGKLYALKPGDGSGDFTFSGGGGSRHNNSGLLAPLSSGTPKIDFANGFPEILLERASSNVLLYSQILSSQTVSLGMQSYILSFYGTGSVTINENTPIILIGHPDGSRKHIMFQSSGGSKNITVTGEVRNAQLEPLNNQEFYNFPTSWIPTAGTSASRNVSSLLKTGLSHLLNQNEGTVYFEVRRQGRGNLFRLDDNSNNNTVRFFNTGSSGNTIEVRYTKNGQESLNSTTSIPLPVVNKIALSYDYQKCTIAINGLNYAILNNIGLFSILLNRMSFLCTESTINRLKCFLYIPNILTNDELLRISEL